MLSIVCTSCNNSNNIKVINLQDTTVTYFYGLKKIVLKETRFLKNTKFGEIRELDKNGRIVTKEIFPQKGEKQKFQYWYHDNGKLKTSVTFVNDTAHGLMYQYYKTGELMSIANFYHGKKRGEMLTYFKNQNLKQYSFFTRSGNVGYEKTYDSTGYPAKEFGSGLLDKIYYPSKSKYLDTIHLECVFVLPPHCLRKFSVGDIKKNGIIVNEKQKSIERDFVNTYDILLNEKRKYIIEGYFSLFDSISKKTSKWHFEIPELDIN